LPTADQKQIKTIFDKLESDQIEFLDQSGKRIIELCTGLLGVLFAVSAFGDKFPPPYIAGNLPAKGLAVAVLTLLILALRAGFLVVRPRRYRRYDYNLSAMRAEITLIVEYKRRWFNVAAWLFVLGSLALAGLVASILLTA